MQCLAVFYVGVVIGELLTGGAKVDVVSGDIDEILLAEPPFGVDARCHRLRQIDRDAGNHATQ